jgi:excisionase family DNA binding protein
MSGITDRPLDQPWLTVEQAAAYSGFTIHGIRQKIRDGNLPAYKARGSRRVRIHADDLEGMITNGRESLAARIRRALADHADEMPDLTDEQIRLAARLLPEPETRQSAAEQREAGP